MANEIFGRDPLLNGMYGVHVTKGADGINRFCVDATKPSDKLSEMTLGEGEYMHIPSGYDCAYGKLHNHGHILIDGRLIIGKLINYPTGIVKTSEFGELETEEIF
ncbi:TPA_asm: hypothetical protein [Altiarchaeum virus]|nr:TPA_asm: hypothetical protein [Altiarchaeum virus]